MNLAVWYLSLALLIVYPFAHKAQAATIKVEPSWTVSTGTELLFDASDFLEEDPTLAKASFEWDFGDSYSIASPDGGVSVTHIYMYPGSYDVTLKITDVNNNSTISRTRIQVTGLPQVFTPITPTPPIVDIRFDDDLQDLSDRANSVDIVGANPKYVPSRRGKGIDLQEGYLRIRLEPPGGLVDECTISFWMKKIAANGTGCLFDCGSLKVFYPVTQYPGRVLVVRLQTKNSTYQMRNFWITKGFDTDWHHCLIVYNGGNLSLYIDGYETVRGHCSGQLELRDIVTVGADLNGSERLGLCVDDIAIYTSYVDPEAFTRQFELLHADFHGHIAQYIYAQIPTYAINQTNWKLIVTVRSTTGSFEKVIFDKVSLNQEERFLLRQAELPKGLYVLSAKLINLSTGTTYEITEPLAKDYDGIPYIGIDENNAICVNGKPFFPVTPWILNDEQLQVWAHRYINALYGYGWLGGGYGGRKGLESWQYYLNQASKCRIPTIGPGACEGSGSRNSNLNKFRQHVETTKDNPWVLMWMWDDEPDLGGPTGAVPPQVVRSWTYMCHQADSQHLVATNFAGAGWTWSEGWHVSHRLKYEYPSNSPLFGGRGRFVADVYGFDYYPIDWVSPSARNAKVAYIPDILQNMRRETRDLVPIMSFVETCDIYEPPYPTPWHPTPEQIRMLCWLNVVHGAKGINWFHHRSETPAPNYGVMQEFYRHVQLLTPVILSPQVPRSITDTSNEPGNRVDTMCREVDGFIWLFAVRVTEVNETNVIRTTFQIENLDPSARIVKPAELNRSACEYKGDPVEAKKIHTFSLTQCPIIPGSVIIHARVPNKSGSIVVQALDAGNGQLKVVCPGFGNSGGVGTVDYKSGQIFIDFGSTPAVGENRVLAGEANLAVMYMPVGQDTIIEQTAGAFTDTFVPNDVHIYRISIVNHAPELVSLLPHQGRESDPVQITVFATDPDGDRITYSTEGLPAGASFSGQTFTWTPQVGQAGVYQVTFVASDGRGGQDSETVTITVLPAQQGNRAPVLEPIGDKSVVKGTLLSFTLAGSDPDGDTVSYWATGLPAGAVLSGNSFSWTPGYDQVGSYKVSFTASDGKGGQDSETITITVRDINRSPVLGPMTDKTVQVGSTLSFSLSATDPDGDQISLSASGLPEGASLVGQVFSWTPGPHQAGSYSVTFTASDGRLQDSRTITITVISSDTRPPFVYGIRPKPNAIQVPTNPLISLHVADDGLGVDGNSVTVLVNGQTVYTGNTDQYVSQFGVCSRSGSSNDYKLNLQPKQGFEFDQTVVVAVTAKDLAGNVMDPCMYSFYTQMRLFGRNIKVSGPAGLDKGRPSLATAGNGDIWVAYHTGPAAARDIYVARFDIKAKAFTQPIALTGDSADQCNPVIAISDNNCVYVVWQDNSRGNWDLCARSSKDGTNWSGLARLTDSNDNEFNPAIAVDHRNPHRVYVAWQDDRRGNSDIFVSFTDNAFIGATYWQVTSSSAEQVEPAIAITADNTVYLAWTDYRNPSADIYASSSNNSFGSNVPVITRNGNQSKVQIAAGPTGSALYLVWQDDRHGNPDVFYATTQGLPTAPVDGTRIIDDTSGAAQTRPALAVAATPTGQLGVFACWEDGRSIGGSSDTDIYFADLGPGCIGTNVFVGDDRTRSNQSAPAMAADRHGQPYIAWVDDRDGSQEIYLAFTVYAVPQPITQGLVQPRTGGTIGPDTPARPEDVAVKVPPGAVDAPLQITVSPVEAAPSTVIEPVAGYDLGPSGIQFSQPVTVTIPHEAESTNIVPCWYDPTTDSVSQEGITDVNTVTLPSGLKATTFKTTHFTQFYIFDLGDSDQTQDPIERISGGGGCSVVHGGPGQVTDLFAPFALLGLIMAIVAIRDRRRAS